MNKAQSGVGKLGSSVQEYRGGYVRVYSSVRVCAWVRVCACVHMRVHTAVCKVEKGRVRGKLCRREMLCACML